MKSAVESPPPLHRDTCEARRRLVRGVVGLAALAGVARLRAQVPQEDDRAAARSAHFPFGPVVPARIIPAWQVTTQLSQKTTLAALLRDKVSALQLMFTGCSATCPIQGALFAAAQKQLGDTPGMQFISLSIAPTGDTPAALNAWLQQFGARRGWLALQPKPDDVGRIFAVLGDGGEKRDPQSADPHKGQVYIIDREGRLVSRTPSMPPAARIVSAMRTAGIS